MSTAETSHGALNISLLRPSSTARYLQVARTRAPPRPASRHRQRQRQVLRMRPIWTHTPLVTRLRLTQGYHTGHACPPASRPPRAITSDHARCLLHGKEGLVTRPRLTEG